MTTEDRGGDTRRTLVWGLAVLALLLVGIGLGEWHTSEQISKESSELWAGLSEAILALMLFFAGFIVALSALVLALTARRARAAALVVLAIAVAVPLATAGDSGESATAPRIEGWKPLGPGGKGVNSIVVDPRTPGTVYAGIDSDEAVKSTDGGESWDGLGIELNEAGLLVVDPAPPRVVYAARTDFPNDFVMKSTDGGESWTGANRGLQGGEGGLDPGVTAIALHPARSRTLYAATQAGGIYRSTNGGRSWSRVSRDHNKIVFQAIAIDPKRPSIMYAGMAEAFSGRLFKSTDGGRSWHALPLGDAVVSIAIDPRMPRTVYVSSTIATYKSVDAGRSWKELGFGRDISSGALALDPSRPDTLYVAGSAAFTDQGVVLKSTNGGRSWATVASTDHKVSDIDAFFGEHNLAVDSTGRRVYVGTPGAGILVCETCWGVQSPR